jgi:hypothetical protein
MAPPTALPAIIPVLLRPPEDGELEILDSVDDGFEWVEVCGKIVGMSGKRPIRRICGTYWSTSGAGGNYAD